MTSPGAPSMSATRAACARHEGPRHGLGATHLGPERWCALGLPADARGHRGGIGPEHHVRIEHGQERREVAAARGGEEGGDDLPAPVAVGVPGFRLALHPPPCPARELPGGVEGAADDRRDLVEGQVEHVVEDEGDAFRRGQPLEGDEERQADRIGERHVVIRSRRGARNRLGGMRVEALLLPEPPRTEHVEADAADHRRQPAAKVADVAGIGTAHAKPRLLHGILGLRPRAEHAIGDRLEVRAGRLELSGKLVLFGHRVTVLRRASSWR